MFFVDLFIRWKEADVVDKIAIHLIVVRHEGPFRRGKPMGKRNTPGAIAAAA